MAIAQLVAEIQANLRTVENGLDLFFRDPADRSGLAALEKPVVQVLGAFRMLNEGRAAEALEECAKIVRRFSDPEYRPREFDFEYVAGVLSGPWASTPRRCSTARPTSTPRCSRSEIAAPSSRSKRPTRERRDGRDRTRRLAARHRRAAPALWRAAPDDAERRDDLARAGRVDPERRDARRRSRRSKRPRERALALLDDAVLQADSAELAGAVARLAPTPGLETQALARDRSARRFAARSHRRRAARYLSAGSHRSARDDPRAPRAGAPHAERSQTCSCRSAAASTR